MPASFRLHIALCTIFSCGSAAYAADYGRTQGSFSVSPSGAATYSIPIWTPPGPNGLTPSLSLAYNSQSENGLAGVGWSLAAVSAIERCPRTRGQDTIAAPVDLSLNDRFCIDGKRLRLHSGAYGAPNSVYFTEIADFSRITAYSSQGNGPQYFIVEAKSGLKFEYGATASSRVVLGATVLRWMLNRVYDRSGNNYVVSYNNSTGFAVPDVISWTPTYLGSPNYKYEAKFNYSTSRVDEDSYLGKVAGHDVSNRNRLESIQIKSASTVVRKYRLAYETSAATSRSRLTSVKECADDAESNCFLPISFGYQAGQVGITATPASGLSNASSLFRGKYDFNGDGRSDLLYVTGSTWKVSLSVGAGFGPAIDTGVSSSATILAHRFLANHQDGLLANIGGVWHYVGYNGSAFDITSTGTPVNSNTYVTDNNGDGIADLVWTSGGSVLARLNVSTAGATVPSFGSSFTAISFSVGQGNVAIINAQNCPVERTCDINGDRRADLIVNVVTVTGCGIGGCSITDNRYDLLASGSGYIAGALTGPIAYTGIRFNDDPCIDRLQTSSTTLQISGCNSSAPTSVSLPAVPILALDWNGDGNGDFLVNNGGFFGVYLSRGTAAAPFSSLITTTIPFSTSCNYFAFDVDGDTFDDIGCVGTNSPFSVSYYTHNGSGGTYLTQQADLLNSITDGFGVSASPSYVSTSQNNYTRGTGTQLPLVDSTDGAIVVAQVTHSNGIGGTFNKTYTYSGAREHRARGESAGFQRVDEIDGRDGVIRRMYFEQTFPLAGMLSQQELMQPNGVTVMARSVITNNFTTLDSASNNQRYFPYQQASTATQYEVSGTWNGALLRTVTTANVFETTGGTLYDQTVTTTEPASGANGVTAGGSWVARTYLPTANLLNDTTNWCLGRPGRIQQINSSNLTYGSSITRTTDVTWNASYCRPTHILTEPGGGTPEVTTAIGYDGFGNVNWTSVTGMGMAARTTTTNYSDATYTTGQFPLNETNALGHLSSFSWDYNKAVPASFTDPNGLTTTWQYDSFGRRVRENHPDTTYTAWTIANCATYGYCLSFGKTFTIRTTRDAANARVTGDLVQLFDGVDRPLIRFVSTLGNSTNLSYALEYQYDAFGRLSQESIPRMSASPDPVKWNTYAYDLMGRLTTASRPISESTSTLQTTAAYYEGLTTRVVDPQNKQSSRVLNAAGQISRSTDHNGVYQAFDYDSFGNLKRVQDSLGNTLQSSSYNIRGMLTSRTDMDMGVWTFVPNALGEIVSQTDAKSQSTTFVFDKLGRLASRSEAEGTSTFNWGNSGSAKNIGKLASISGPGYSESYTFDSLGRPLATTISADTTYSIDYTYNAKGFLNTVAYPTSTNGCRFTIQLGYSFEFLNSVSNASNASQCGSTGETYWTANEGNGFGQIIKEALGNGLVSNRAYDSVTGWLKSIQTGLSGGNSVQNLEYTWDQVGNLSTRKDINQSNLTEAFFYDNLYRLDYSQLNGVQNLNVNYDALGNITHKSDVGNYSYHATKKHQVASTSNGWSFGYDNNGNMTSGRGATFTWTSYNYPASITNGTNTASFSYTPDRRYWRQISNYTSGGAATTIYVGGLLEKVTTSGGTDYRHMIRAGNSTIVVSRKSSGTNSVSYVTSDHLGSSSAITNSAGGILVNSSFDAFGKRRGANWSGSPSTGDWAAIAATTRRGYTEHTMLDNLDLTHMNGRIYDQQIGRFLSADIRIPYPANTQSFNRYSYVRNRPLSLVDPSGFLEEIVVTGTRGSYGPGDNTTVPRGTDFRSGTDVSSATTPAERETGVDGTTETPSEEMETIVVCAGCRRNIGPDPYVRGLRFYELGGMHWASFTASAGWGFNTDKVSEFSGQGPEIAFLAPDLTIQQMDPNLGNEELAPDMYINTVTGEIAFGDVGTLRFDEPWSLDDSPPPPEPEMQSIPIEVPEPPQLTIDLN